MRLRIAAVFLTLAQIVGSDLAIARDQLNSQFSRTKKKDNSYSPGNPGLPGVFYDERSRRTKFPSAPNPNVRIPNLNIKSTVTGYNRKLPPRTKSENPFQELASAKLPAIPNLKHETTYYDIWGRTAAALQSEMDAKGFVLDGGRRAEAGTKWDYKGRKYNAVKNSEGLWKIHSVTYEDVGTIETYPNWQDIWAVQRSLKDQFYSAIFRMRIHEQRHVDTFIGYLRAVEKASLELPPQASLEALDIEWARVIAPIDEAHKFAQDQIDVGPIQPPFFPAPSPPKTNLPKPK